MNIEDFKLETEYYQLYYNAGWVVKGWGRLVPHYYSTLERALEALCRVWEDFPPQTEEDSLLCQAISDTLEDTTTT